ncbi:MAG: MocE family 2Fe-2S type ferredoxin [Paracoccaceae bacterium]|nr:MocE family 2Fe-2S type ferredoxin [Paracoccaceae bacterium]
MPWIDACGADEIDREDVLGWDHGGRAFAIYHGVDGRFYCTDGLCSHEQVRLEEGLVMDFEIECPRHNGLFDYRTGAALRAPACDALATYPVKVEEGRVQVLIE